MSNTQTKYAVRGNVSKKFYAMDLYSRSLRYSPTGPNPEDGKLFDTAREAFKARESYGEADLAVVPVTVTTTQGEPVVSTDLAVQSPEDYFVVVRTKGISYLAEHGDAFNYTGLDRAKRYATVGALLADLQRRGGMVNPWFETIHRVTPGKSTTTYTVGKAL